MAHIQYVDELVKEYLLYRGFTSTLKTFDSELKSDKEKGFRVDKIIEQFVSFITSYDLSSLRDLWAHLESHLFCRLEHHLASNVKKFENSLLKMYLVNASINNKSDKINDFFKQMTSELQNQSEWKEWFMLPFIKSPEENTSFSVYFTKQWQDTLFVSLHNFLACVFQCMPQPTLTNFDEDVTRLRRLQEENESLKARLLQLTEQPRTLGTTNNDNIAASSAVGRDSMDVVSPSHIYDDFYIIAQENNTADNQVKSLKSLIRNIGSSSSPTMSRKEMSSGNSKRKIGSSVMGSKSGK
ncbi:WD repeat-containing protein 91 isoform X2 [Chrysoperla carnea]|uniref:WD repeat-containing protein 91 isoform X2 n=1 Tax=Chrysoperla carnea TaxID=189513 RepID=UPI001D070561|nr:WD repeat-containing protein 91 isoform X2 [Chrysoperla carnea]